MVFTLDLFIQYCIALGEGEHSFVLERRPTRRELSDHQLKISQARTSSYAILRLDEDALSTRVQVSIRPKHILATTRRAS